jgi:hypothetical protein
VPSTTIIAQQMANTRRQQRQTLSTDRAYRTK